MKLHQSLIDKPAVEVQIVEYVVGIDSQFNPGVLAKYGRFGQAKGLHERQVQSLVFRKVERIAMDPGD